MTPLRRWLEPATVAMLLAGLFLFRTLRLDLVPPNVTGDEVTFLNDIIRIVDFPDRVNFMSLMGDGSQSGVNFYLMAAVVRWFPERDFVLGMRVASSLFSTGVLAAFYVYLRTKVRPEAALLATLLLGTNFVFMNLSRSTWMGDGKSLGLACGLLSLWLAERGVARRDVWSLLVAGALGGLALYGYMGTVILPAATLAYLAYLSLRKRLERRDALRYGLAFAGMALVAALPQLVNIALHYERYGARAASASITTLDLPYYGHDDWPGILWHQVAYTARGFLLLDPTVSGEGIENARYGPIDGGFVDWITWGLFFAGVVAAIRARKDLFQPVVAFALTLVVMEVITDFPPNYARGIFVIVFVYLMVGVALDKLWTVRVRRAALEPAVAVVAGGIALWNLLFYFSWGRSADVVNARGPAIAIEEVGLWVDMQRQQVQDRLPDLTITSEAWENRALSSVTAASTPNSNH